MTPDACRAQHNAAFLRGQRERLNQKLKELEEGTRDTVRAVADASGEPPADDLDRAVRNGHQALAVAVANGKHMQLEAVLAARQKLIDGQYGHCDRCLKEIGRARLKAMPAARYCLGCQEVLEAAARQGNPAVSESTSG